MNNQGREKIAPPSVSQFHALIRRSAISRGIAIPETEQEFDLQEESVDSKQLPPHNFQDVLRMIETGETYETHVVPFANNVTTTTVFDEFVQAARNGMHIPAEVQQKMNEDRAEKEREQNTK